VLAQATFPEEFRRFARSSKVARSPRVGERAARSCDFPEKSARIVLCLLLARLLTHA